MKQLDQYLDAVKASEFARDRVAQTMLAFDRLLPETQTIERVFMSNARLEDGEPPAWTDLWAFTKKYWLHAQSFLHRFDVDISGYEKSISYLSIQYEEVDLADSENYGVGPGSTLRVEVETGDDLDSELEAVGENCRFLAEIVFTLLKKNLRSEVF